MLSVQTGCEIETIRYCERIGLLPPPNRTQAVNDLMAPRMLRAFASSNALAHSTFRLRRCASWSLSPKAKRRVTARASSLKRT
jgi:hypothetical protein